jgi:hemin uptake protein HemP
MPILPCPKPQHSGLTNAQSPNSATTLPALQNTLHASDLLGSRQSVEIEYNGQRYRLQTTKAGKLILTK